MRSDEGGAGARPAMSFFDPTNQEPPSVPSPSVTTTLRWTATHPAVPPGLEVFGPVPDRSASRSPANMRKRRYGSQLPRRGAYDVLAPMPDFDYDPAWLRVLDGKDGLRYLPGCGSDGDVTPRGSIHSTPSPGSHQAPCLWTTGSREDYSPLFETLATRPEATRNLVKTILANLRLAVVSRGEPTTTTGQRVSDVKVTDRVDGIVTPPRTDESAGEPKSNLGDLSATELQSIPSPPGSSSNLPLASLEYVWPRNLTTSSGWGEGFGTQGTKIDSRGLPTPVADVPVAPELGDAQINSTSSRELTGVSAVLPPLSVETQNPATIPRRHGIPANVHEPTPQPPHPLAGVFGLACEARAPGCQYEDKHAPSIQHVALTAPTGELVRQPPPQDARKRPAATSRSLAALPGVPPPPDDASGPLQVERNDQAGSGLPQGIRELVHATVCQASPPRPFPPSPSQLKRTAAGQATANTTTCAAPSEPRPIQPSLIPRGPGHPPVGTWQTGLNARLNVGQPPSRSHQIEAHQIEAHQVEAAPTQQAQQPSLGEVLTTHGKTYHPRHETPPRVAVTSAWPAQPDVAASPTLGGPNDHPASSQSYEHQGVSSRLELESRLSSETYQGHPVSHLLGPYSSARTPTRRLHDPLPPATHLPPSIAPAPRKDQWEQNSRTGEPQVLPRRESVDNAPTPPTRGTLPSLAGAKVQPIKIDAPGPGFDITAPQVQKRVSKVRRNKIAAAAGTQERCVECPISVPMPLLMILNGLGLHPRMAPQYASHFAALCPTHQQRYRLLETRGFQTSATTTAESDVPLSFKKPGKPRSTAKVEKEKRPPSKKKVKSPASQAEGGRLAHVPGPGGTRARGTAPKQAPTVTKRVAPGEDAAAHPGASSVVPTLAIPLEVLSRRAATVFKRLQPSPPDDLDAQPSKRPKFSPEGSADRVLRPPTRDAGCRPTHNAGEDDSYRREMMGELKARIAQHGDRQETHGSGTDRRLLALLQMSTPPNTDAQTGPVEALFLSGEEAMSTVEAGSPQLPIITVKQQPFQWNPRMRPIEELFRRMEDLDRQVAVQIPSRRHTDESFESRELAVIRERFLADRPTQEPWNILDLRSPVPAAILPGFLTGENCQLLPRLRDAILQGRRAERGLGTREEWNEWRDVLEWVLLSEGGHNTAPHTDSHGLATWISVQEGLFGFGWMSAPTDEERAAWNARPLEFVAARWRYVVLEPGQTVFFNSGTVHYVFRLCGKQTLALGGHVLQWSGIERWLSVVSAQMSNPDMTNEEMEWSAPKYVRLVADLVERRRRNGRTEEMGGDAAVDRLVKLLKDFDEKHKPSRGKRTKSKKKRTR